MCAHDFTLLIRISLMCIWNCISNSENNNFDEFFEFLIFIVFLCFSGSGEGDGCV